MKLFAEGHLYNADLFCHYVCLYVMSFHYYLLFRSGLNSDPTVYKLKKHLGFLHPHLHDAIFAMAKNASFNYDYVWAMLATFL